jgi:DNA-binding transcriptional ArsR family regulator
MNAEVNLAAIAALMADPTRSQFLLQLLDGRALPAGELARFARVAPSTASSHLTRLVEGGLLCVHKQGRHRYYRLAGPEVGHVLETLATIAPPQPVCSLREAETGKAIRFARTCYDHLAGKLGVGLARAMLEQGWLVAGENNFAPTPGGEDRFVAFGIDLASLRKQRRAFAPCCLDWSERRHHVAGALGAALATRLVEMDWLRRQPGTRALQLTAAGRVGLADTFGFII